MKNKNCSVISQTFHLKKKERLISKIIIDIKDFKDLNCLQKTFDC